MGPVSPAGRSLSSHRLEGSSPPGGPDPGGPDPHLPQPAGARWERLLPQSPGDPRQPVPSSSADGLTGRIHQRSMPTELCPGPGSLLRGRWCSSAFLGAELRAQPACRPARCPRELSLPERNLEDRGQTEPPTWGRGGITLLSSWGVGVGPVLLSPLGGLSSWGAILLGQPA